MTRRANSITACSRHFRMVAIFRAHPVGGELCTIRRAERVQRNLR